jgi:hypothetical protein
MRLIGSQSGQDIQGSIEQVSKCPGADAVLIGDLGEAVE